MARIPTKIVTNGKTKAIINLTDLPEWLGRGWLEVTATPSPGAPAAIILPPPGAPAIGGPSVMPETKPPPKKRSGTPKV